MTFEMMAERFEVHLRKQVAKQEDPSAFESVTQIASWKSEETAIIVCDMWDLHHCKNAVTRVGEMTDRMNAVLTEARNAGALIIHSPSSCMDFYQGHPGRLEAMQAPTAKNLPEAIDQWCYIIPEEEKASTPLINPMVGKMMTRSNMLHGLIISKALVEILERPGSDRWRL